MFSRGELDPDSVLLVPLPPVSFSVFCEVRRGVIGLHIRSKTGNLVVG